MNITDAQLRKILTALDLAVEWEISVADCWEGDAPERKENLAHAREYRKLAQALKEKRKGQA